jgi:hypothetical protein
MRTDPCNKCGSSDRYEKGTFSYCRVCHAEAQRNYLQRKATGEQTELLKPPSLPLYALDRKNHFGRNKVACSKGHPLHGDNVRISSQRNGKHLHRRCRTCERNAKRVQYGLAVERTATMLSDLLDGSL